jgi:hypothetical protein
MNFSFQTVNVEVMVERYELELNPQGNIQQIIPTVLPSFDHIRQVIFKMAHADG